MVHDYQLCKPDPYYGGPNIAINIGASIITYTVLGGFLIISIIE